MAKRPALFDVITRDRPIDQQNRPGPLRMLARWFRSRASGNSAVPAPAALPVETVAVPADMAAPPPPVASRNHLAVDRSSASIALSLSYTSAAIGIIAVITAIAAAFMIGQKSAQNRPLLGALTDDEQREARPRPGVLNLANIPRTPVPPEPQQPAPITPAPNTAVSATRPAGPLRRDPNLNYVLVQSYPAAEKKMAEEARDLLIRNGIDCTIEQGVPGWQNAYAVVGTLGFSRISSNQQLDAYISKIRQLSATYHARRNSFKAFDPVTLKWKKSA